MCGIIGAFHKKELGKVNDVVVNIYEDQHSRGSQGFGIVGIDGNMKTHLMRATESAKFMFDLHKKDFNMMIAHHRMPTSTPNKLSQTHPIFVSNEILPSDFLVIHNGVIRNGEKLNKEHEELGFKYTTEYQKSEKWITWNDTEVVAIEMALFISGIRKKIMAEGSAALIALEVEKKTGKLKMVHFGRNDTNPLKLAASRKKIILSSEGPGSDVKPEMLYSFDPKGDFSLTSKKMEFHKEPYKPYTAPSYPLTVKSDASTGANTEPAHFKPSYLTHDWDKDTKTWKLKKPACSANHAVQLAMEKPITGFQATEQEEIDEMEKEDAMEAEFNALYEEVELEVQEFYAAISDPTTCEFTEVKPYLDSIAKVMERVKKGYMKFYEEEALRESIEDARTYGLVSQDG